ncbi:MAG: dihydroorotase family protein [Chloroflexota bacterium]|nr:dihydroorotase family protein [Chloroflexota bacterium]
MRYDLVVSGDVVTPDGLQSNAAVAVRNGRITEVRASAEDLDSSRRIDAHGCFVLPGAIDAHVHCFSEPREGFVNATRAAAAGGVTTIVEMPYDAGAPVNQREVLERKIERLQREAVVDVALLGTIRKTGGLAAIPALIDAGVCGFKLSMFETDPERFPRIANGDLFEALRTVGQAGLTVGVHAEDGDIIYPLVAAYQAANKRFPRAHCKTRPPVSETAAVALALELAAQAEAPLHIYHASLPRSFELLANYRRQGARATGETCPHYLVLDESDMDHLGGYGKINPPLRHGEARAGLWRLLAQDAVDMVASDHAPWPRDRKDDRQDIFANASGVPGVETLLPLLYSEGVAAGRLDIRQAVRLLAEGPARTFGLLARKGRIAPGADADMVVLDPSATWTLRGADLHSSAGWTPYEGRLMTGRVRTTLVRGQVVYEAGEVVGRPGGGQFIGPSA